MRKRTVTTIETHQIVIVRRPEGTILGRCPACLKDVEMVSLEEASVLAGVNLLEICRRVSEDDVHLTMTENGGLVCLDSLLKKVSVEDPGINANGPDIPLLRAADLGDDSQQ